MTTSPTTTHEVNLAVARKLGYRVYATGETRDNTIVYPCVATLSCAKLRLWLTLEDYGEFDPATDLNQTFAYVCPALPSATDYRCYGSQTPEQALKRAETLQNITDYPPESAAMMLCKALLEME